MTCHLSRPRLYTPLIVASVISIASLRSSTGFAAEAESPATTVPSAGSKPPAPPDGTKAAVTESGVTKSKSPEKPDAQHPFDWSADVLGPIARLGGIAIVLGVLLWSWGLPGLLNSEAWTERTILAFAVVLTFCAAALMNKDTLTPLKDVALVVIGFYFGSAKTDHAKTPSEPVEPQKGQGPSPDQHPK